MSVIRRRPTTLPNYSRTRVLGSILLATAGFICLAILVKPSLSLPHHKNSQSSDMASLRPIWPLVTICFAIMVNGFEIYHSGREPIIYTRSRKFLGWLITTDVLGILFLVTPAILTIPFGHMQVPLDLGLVIIIFLACGLQGLALSFVCREEKLRRAQLKETTEASMSTEL